MNWQLLLQTFLTVFVAEIGDKTQLATMGFAAGGSSRWAVFLGSSAALVATSAIAVLAGEAVSRVVPPHWIKRGAGALFLVMGVLFLFSKAEPPASEASSPPHATER